MTADGRRRTRNRKREMIMTPFEDYVRYETRRQFLRRGGNALGTAALATLVGPDLFA